MPLSIWPGGMPIGRDDDGACCCRPDSLLIRMRFGPDGKWTSSADDYTVEDPDSTLRDEFYESIARYLPSVSKQKLIPAYAGIRPKLAYPASFRDFMIREESALGYPRLVNLLGIESPGLTASLAIARRVAALLQYNAHVPDFDL